MATTTPNYGWTVPTSTDLVKDGATAIETLGDAIDASLVDLRGGTTGQVLKKASNTQMDFEWGTASSGLTLINTTSFSGVTSFSLPSDTFTSTYTNYLLIVAGTASETSFTDVSLRLRASGSDNTTTNYIRATYNRTNSAAGNASTGSLTGFSQIGAAGNISWHLTTSILQPKISDRTLVNAQSMTIANSNNNATWTQGIFNDTTSFDSATVFPAAGTISGTYSVYGYAK